MWPSCCSWSASPCWRQPAAGRRAPPRARLQTTTPGETTASTEPTTGTSGGGGEPIKIGVIASLTGPAAAPVESVMNSLKLEADRVNAAGGVNGRQLELIVEDDGSVVDKAIAAATKLIKQDNVTVLLGPFPPYELPAVRQIAEDAQVPEIIYQPPSLDQLATPYKWSFTNRAERCLQRLGRRADHDRERLQERGRGPRHPAHVRREQPDGHGVRSEGRPQGDRSPGHVG